MHPTIKKSKLFAKQHNTWTDRLQLMELNLWEWREGEIKWTGAKSDLQLKNTRAQFLFLFPQIKLKEMKR